MDKKKVSKKKYCCCGYEFEFVSDEVDGRFYRCPYCGAAILHKDFEIKVVGKVANEVKEVSEHLLKQVSEYPNKTNKEKIMSLFLNFFNKKIKCKSFYNVQSRTVDLKGLQVGLVQKINIGLTSFIVDTKYQEASEHLRTLDLLQYSISNDINGISDQNQRDKLLKKLIETKSQMIEIVIGIIREKNTDIQ